MMDFRYLLFVLCALYFSACNDQPAASEAAAGKLRITCTTGMIGDGVQQIVGEYGEVTTLMGPGVDPHLYKATQGDLRALTQADIIVYNGLHLEGKMGEILERLERQKPIIAVTAGIPPDQLINSTAFAGAQDPHIWFDISLWARAIDYTARQIAAIDTAHAEIYLANAQRYTARLDSLHAEVKAQIATIPRQQRVLITAHDAFSYFGRAYDIEVRGLQGISTLSEYGLRDISELVGFISNRGIKAVFVESSVPRKSLEAVVEGSARQGHTVRIGGTLYSDAMGQAGTPEDNYIGMVEANVRTIVEALK